MENTLRRIYSKHASQREWYKLRNGGKCPNRDGALAPSYLQEFGCTGHEQPWQRSDKYLSARQCAYERMADMKFHISSGRLADTGHIYPIKLAYDLGKKCLDYSDIIGSKSRYTNQFRQWYNELIHNSPETHRLFQGEEHTIEYPLESYDSNKNGEILNIKRRNLMIYNLPSKTRRFRKFRKMKKTRRQSFRG